MKKMLSLILNLIMMLPCMGITSFAEEDIRIVTDGAYQNYDVMPIIDNSRALVPRHGIFEALGAEAAWDDSTQTITAAKEDVVVMLQMNNTTAWVNGESKTLDVPAKIVSGEAMVPVRFIAESFGCRVEWDGAKRRIFINSPLLHETAVKALDGKKVLFAGNANLYHSRVVINNKTLDQESRTDVQGAFYQLCKSNGLDVTITNWCFANHKIADVFGGKPCTVSGTCKDEIHENYLTDKNYDYVVLSPSEGEDITESIDYIMNFFKEANPDTEFILLGSAMQYGFNKTGEIYEEVISKYESLEKKGVKTADWGKVAADSVKYGVEGVSDYFDNYSYVVKDGVNPNLLAGFTAQIMAYCAITGEKAQNQPHDFYFDTQLVPDIDIPGYVEYYYYNGDKDTISGKIFDSEESMDAFKKFIDQHMDGTYEAPEKPFAQKPAESEETAIKVACAGDSITFGSGIKNGRHTYSYPARLAAKLGEEYNVSNFGKSGYCVSKASDKTYWKTMEYKDFLGMEADIVVIMFGTNDMRTDRWLGSDVTGGAALKDTYVDDYCALVESYRQVNPDVKVYIMIPPALNTAEGADRPRERMPEEVIPRIKEVADKTGANIIELYPLFENKAELFADTLHPNNEGAEIIAETVYKAIMENRK